MLEYLKKNVNLNSLLLVALLGLLKWEAASLYRRIDRMEDNYLEVVQRLARVEAVNGLTTATIKPTNKP